MTKENLKLELPVFDLGILRACLQDKVKFWKNGLKSCEEGEASPCDFEDCQCETDLEFNVERHDNILRLIDKTMSPIRVNGIEYLDDFQMFRNTQRVECVRLLGHRTTKLIFVFHTRHGSHFFYDQMEALVQHFLDDSEPEHRFESEAELEWFLKFWKVG